MKQITITDFQYEELVEMLAEYRNCWLTKYRDTMSQLDLDTELAIISGMQNVIEANVEEVDE